MESAEPEPQRESHDPSTVDRFLAAYWADVDDGTVHPLGHYLALFPEARSEIIAEYVAIEAAAPSMDGAKGSHSQKSGKRSRHVDSKSHSRSFGHYRLESQLGQGGQGTVWRAIDMRLGRVVALKILNVGLALSMKGIERFRREAETTARLSHPGLCTVYEAGQIAGQSFIAMRYVDGETLAGRIARSRAAALTSASSQSVFFAPPPRRTGDSRPPEDVGSADDESAATESPRTAADPRGKTPTSKDELRAIVGFFERIARAMHVAHEAGIVHRDLKPHNIMIAPDGEPVVLDFGLAKDELSDSSTLSITGDFLGTPDYCSPEQITGGRSPIDRRTDIWSLGVTLFECLTLKKPFESVTREQLFAAILSKPPLSAVSANPQLPKDLTTIITVCLDKDKDRRYATMAALADDLGRFLAHEPIRARPAGPLLRMKRWAQRNPVAMTIICALILLTAVTMGAARETERRRLAESGQQESNRLAAIATAAEADANAALIAAAPNFLQRVDDELWPRRTSKIGEFREWIKVAERIVAQAPRLKAESLGSGPSAKRSRKALQDIAKLEASIPVVIERIRSAEALAVDTVTGPTARALWKECIEAIRNDSKYSSPNSKLVDLRPIEGLLPLGPNPTTGLFEFWHVESGSRPQLVKDDGNYRIDGDSGIVLILLPSSSCWIGAQKDDPRRRNFDPDAVPDAEPLRLADLPTFFISKFETTRGQWTRLMGAPLAGWKESGANLPASNVAWLQAYQFGLRADLRLPSESEWESSCRAGTSTPYWSGDGDLWGVAWLNDNSGGKVHRVGALQSNPWGLYDVHGNVMEWCQDIDRENSFVPIAESAASSPDLLSARVLRGGSWKQTKFFGRSAARNSCAPTYNFEDLGFRAARHR